MAQVREHPWVLEKRFGGAMAGDQGSFNTNEILGDDNLTYRGMNGGVVYNDVDPMLMDDEDAPVYRSLGMGDAGAEAAAVPLPGLCRQKAMSNLFGELPP